MKRIVIAGAVLLVLGLLIIGQALPALAQVSGNGGNAYTTRYIDQPTLERLAEALKLTPEDLSARLEAGSTLAEIGAEQGVAEDALIAAIVAPYREQLRLRVSYKYITQKTADALLKRAERNASLLLDENLSVPSYDEDFWGQMASRCGAMMGGYGGGGMMGGGMMGGYGGSGMMGGGMMGGNGGGMMGGYGSAGMMGRATY